jgi:DNA-binding CsgD family transcriptional regulator
VFVAGELELVAEALRRLTRLEPGERRVMAAKLAGLGFGRREIAARLGISERAVFGYLRHGAEEPTPV